jgi:hypothetical protein
MTLLLVTVNGPTEVAGSGSFNVTPVAGTGFGIATLKDEGAVAIDAGVAPMAWTSVATEPTSVGWTTLKASAVC